VGVLKVNVDGQWIEISQTGPPGPTGPQGPQGIQGVQGPARTVKNFAMWLNTGIAMATDGEIQIPFQEKYDPSNMVSNLNTFVAPTSGLVLINVSVLFSLSGSPTSASMYSSIMENGAVIRRGNQITGGVNLGWFLSIAVAQVMVTAGKNYTAGAYANQPGIAKTIYGGRLYTYMEGVYL
jgi:hypothetical protein